MADNLEFFCPECDEQDGPPEGLGRRDFLRAGGAAALGAGGLGAASADPADAVVFFRN